MKTDIFVTKIITEKGERLPEKTTTIDKLVKGKIR